MRRFKQLLVFLFWPVFSFGKSPLLSVLGMLGFAGIYQGWRMASSPQGEITSGSGVLFLVLALCFYLFLGFMTQWHNHSIKTP